MAYNQQELELIQLVKERGGDANMARQAIANYRSGTPVSTPQTITKPSFIQETAQDIKETGKALSETMQSAEQRRQEIKGAMQSGEQGVIRSGLQAIGTGASTASKSIGDVFTGLLKVFSPQSLEDKTTETIQGVVRPVMQSAPVQKLMSTYEGLSPAQQRDVDAAVGTLSLLTDIAGMGAGKALGGAAATGVKAAERTGADIASAGARIAGGALNKGADTGKIASEFAFTQVTGLSPDTLKTIIKSPRAFEDAQKSGMGRFTVAQQVEDKINTKIADLSETGAAYKSIREKSGELAGKVSVAPDFVDSEIRKAGFSIEDGKIIATTKSPTRNRADINALQEFYNNWAGKDTLGADEFLNMRTDLAELANFDKISGKTSVSDTIAKGIRKSLNNNYRGQIAGLKELDDKFSVQVAEVKALKKEFFDPKTGELKDSAINRIANATGKGKDKLLDRLRELDPQIEDQVRMIKALEDVEYAKGQKVGTYLRAGIGIGVGVSNPIAGFSAFVLTSPDMVVNYLKFVAEKSPAIRNKILGIEKKIADGTKLTGEEASLFSKALNAGESIQDAFLQSVGIVGVPTLKQQIAPQDIQPQQ